jgi:thioredoxin 1
MDQQPDNPPSPSPPWLLILGLLLGGGLIVFMAWESIESSFRKDTQRESPNLVHLTNETWQKEVIESDIPVLVDFSAEWCGPCHMLAPTINKLADRYKGKVKVAKFDVGDNFVNGKKLRKQYRFDGIPHVIIFMGGVPRAKFTGAQVPESDFASALDKLL